MSTPSMPDLRFLRKGRPEPYGCQPGPTRPGGRRTRKKTDVPENKSCPIQLAMNLLFYRSYGFFARTGGNRPARTDGRTSPKKFATYLKTKVSRLKKLVETSVDPVDAGLTVSARGSPGAIRPAYPSGWGGGDLKLGFVRVRLAQTKVVRFN